MHERDEHEKERTLLEEKLISVAKMYEDLQEIQRASEEQAAQEHFKIMEAHATMLAEHQAETARLQEEHSKQLTAFKESVGLDPRYTKMPDSSYKGSDSSRGLPNWMSSV